MQERTMIIQNKSQKARTAIRIFKTTSEALALRGYYKPSGRSGQSLAESLKQLSPEIYGSINDPRIIEIKGLEYVIDRLPCGFEECNRIIMTSEENLNHTAFLKIIPRKRRRASYRTGPNEMTFIVTRGMSEIYDILTHMTFCNMEAEKIHAQMKTSYGELTREWQLLIKHSEESNYTDRELDMAVWNLSLILGRTFEETKQTYLNLEQGRLNSKTNEGLFKIIRSLGERIESEKKAEQNELLIHFTPSLRDLIGNHKYGREWADNIKMKLIELGLRSRDIHIISANMHSVVNTVYAYAALTDAIDETSRNDLYTMIQNFRDRQEDILTFAKQHGLHEIQDTSGTYIDSQIIDTSALSEIDLHPSLNIDTGLSRGSPVILVTDYAFGEQAFEVLDELLSPQTEDGTLTEFRISSISVMGKAGILQGKKGDIILANAHVFEGTPHSYIVDNDLTSDDFDGSIDIFTGPIVTVLGTSLQNRDVLEKFQNTTWKAVGLEMEGGHYQRAINAAIIRGHISPNVKTRYAYYASDNPLLSGQTLASGGLGDDGIRPTYMITRVIIEKILADC